MKHFDTVLGFLGIVGFIGAAAAPDEYGVFKVVGALLFVVAWLRLVARGKLL